MMDGIVFYAVSAIFQPFNGGDPIRRAINCITKIKIETLFYLIFQFGKMLNFVITNKKKIYKNLDII